MKFLEKIKDYFMVEEEKEESPEEETKEEEKINNFLGYKIVRDDRLKIVKVPGAIIEFLGRDRSPEIEKFKQEGLEAINSYDFRIDHEEYEKQEVLEIIERFKIDFKKELGLEEGVKKENGK